MHVDFRCILPLGLQVEDLARSGVKLAGRVARKAVRPILLGIMVNRVLKVGGCTLGFWSSSAVPLAS